MWDVESGLAREAVIGSAVTRWWSGQDGGQTEGLLLMVLRLAVGEAST